MIEIRKLPADKFHLLKDVFEKVFESDPPLPENSEILCAFEDGKFAGFVLAETVVLVGQIYVIPEKRESSSKIANSLIRFIEENIAPRVTVGAIASESRFENLYRKFGMQKITGTFFRRNTDF